VVSIITGLVITFVPRTEAERMLAYQIFFVLAFIIGLFEVRMFMKLQVTPSAQEQEPAEEKASPPRRREIFGTIVHDKRFRRFFVTAIFFMFTWQAGWPLFAFHQVRVLQATELWFAIFALTAGVSAFISGGFWQKWLRRYGNNRIFVISGLLLAANTTLAPFVPNVQMMAVLSIFTGFSAIGINTALLNGVLEATPDENRMIYLAFYNTMVNVSLFVAPFFAHLLFSLWGNAAALFIVSGLRVVSTGIIWRVQKS
jgi:Na+/melibiose symporter-like transporter